MKRMNLRHVLTILSGIMTSLMSCSDEVANNQNLPAEDETRFTLTVPGLQTPFTRSMDGAPEKHIEEIDILVFSHAASSMGVLEEHIPVSETILQADNSGVYEVSFKANLSRGTTPKCIVVIANAHDVILNLNLSPGATKANVLQSLIVNQGSKWPVGSTYDPIPMYGETVVSSVDSDISGISLKRMLARIDVENKATANFTLSEVILYNRNTNGLVAPPVGNATTGEADMNAVLPHLPATPAKDISGLSYPLVSGSTGLFGDIYAFEADSATDASGTDHNDRKNATCLVLKGEYEGSDYYYRVDFTHDGSDSSMAGEYMPLLRNHRYQVDITTVQGVGYQTAAEAVAAYSMPSNMRVRTIVYDEGKLSYISYNGQYMVGTNTKSDGILFKAAGEAQSYYAMTDYPGGISVLAIDTEGQSLSSASGTNPSVTLSWLTASLSGDQLTITATANPSHTTERQATLTLTAGRLRHEVEIRQDRLVKTSNCYITPPDSTIRILVSRANEDGTTRINPSDALTAELVWTDNPNGIAANSNIAAISTTGTGSAGELIVTAGSTTGNAVVAVKVGGVIRWSWHIWVVDPSDRPKESGSAGFMDRNLGAITNTPGLVSTFGLHYQWGRKDPFVGLASVNIPLETLIYDAMGNVFTVPHSTSIIPNNLENAIMNPVTLYYNGSVPYDWYTNSFSNQNDMLWGENSSKTVYDPCPEGWRVSPDIWTTTGWTSQLRGLFNVDFGGYYPEAGSRLTSPNGGLHYNFDGYYWCSSIGPQVFPTIRESRYFFQQNTSFHYSNYTRGSAMSVRCIRE